jgi:hypothetical protein
MPRCRKKTRQSSCNSQTAFGGISEPTASNGLRCFEGDLEETSSLNLEGHGRWHERMIMLSASLQTFEWWQSERPSAISLPA